MYMCCRQPARALHPHTNRLVSAGAKAATAKAGDLVTVDYTGTLDDGSVIDTSRKEGGTPLEFVTGKGMVSGH
jgi:FKBP-type peptidyl-prolyl cis-trans isomerase